MAREVQLYAGIAAAKQNSTGGYAFLNTFTSTVATNSPLRNYDMAGSKMGGNTFSAATSDAAVTIPAGISTVGVIMIENLDPTNYVELSLATGGSFAASVFETIRPGAIYMGRPPTTFYAKANTAACTCQISAVEGALTKSA